MHEALAFIALFFAILAFLMALMVRRQKLRSQARIITNGGSLTISAGNATWNLPGENITITPAGITFDRKPMKGPHHG